MDHGSQGCRWPLDIRPVKDTTALLGLGFLEALPA